MDEWKQKLKGEGNVMFVIKHRGSVIINPTFFLISGLETGSGFLS
jgi:hypothetical protein